MIDKDSGIYGKIRKKVERALKSEKTSRQPWASLLLLAPDLFYLLTRLVRDPRVPMSAKIKLGAALAYFVSPIDIASIAFFGPIGLLEDVAIAAYALHSVLNQVDASVVQEHWVGEGNILEAIQKILEVAHETLGGRVIERLAKRFKFK
jgi:uncharacterized membrane protein YkvA (DUF1232 family)